MKKIVDRHSAESLLALVKMGKARVVKEHTDCGPEYACFSSSGTPIGVIGARWAYLFEAALIQQGAGDGLFEGHSQTVRAS